MKLSKGSGRVYWIIMMMAVITMLALLFFSPSVHAQELGNAEDEELLKTFRQVFDFVRQNYVDDVESQVLIDGALKGLFESLDDPYSAYLDAGDLRSLGDTTSGEFGGVGLYINKVRTSEDQPELKEWVEIVSPIEGTPAYRAGLRPRDLIIEIEDESTIDLSIDEVVDRLRGQPNTNVQVTILRKLETRLTINLRRAIIEIPTVRYAGIQDDIGYVRIIQFTPRTAEKTQEALEDLRSQGYQNMIVDLRTNPGGLLNAAIDTADLFFNDGLVVGTAGRTDIENQTYFAQSGTSIDNRSQIVVLINEGTASAAEILAGALKDRGRAALVGEKSFGKGSVQQIRVIGESGFRLTMAKYYTPGKIFIDQIGISPDIVVEEVALSSEEDISFASIQMDGRIEQFLDNNNNRLRESNIQSFIADLRSEGLSINERLLRRLIRLELEARLNTPSVFDLDYDLVLQEAVQVLLEGNIQSIIDNREVVTPEHAVLPQL